MVNDDMNNMEIYMFFKKNGEDYNEFYVEIKTKNSRKPTGLL